MEREPPDEPELLEDGMGRGKRALKPRLITVDGQAVLRLNNYDLADGEGSVWAQELDGSSHAQPVARPAPSVSERAPPPPRPVSVPRPPTDAQRALRERNDEIRADKEAAARRRHGSFIPEHASLFAEFGAKMADAVALSPAELAGLTAAVDAAAVLEPPAQIRVQMRDYQRVGLRWLATAHARGHSAILADEMGLGKTLQTIAFLAHLKFNLGVQGPHLVLCPLSVLSSWMSEFKRFCPEMRVIKLHSSDPEERRRLKTEVLSAECTFDVVVTTYDMAKSDDMQATLLSRRWWQYVVLDEGHIIKNEHSDVSKAARRLHCAGALLLTGTPLQNNLHELWALLYFLFPELFPSSNEFDSAFKLASNKGQDEVDTDKLRRAHALLGPLMLRRVKAEVEKGLPSKLETTIECPLSEMQSFWYRRLLLRDSALLAQLEAEATGAAAASGSDWKKLASLMMQLRKVCNHPYMIDGADGSGALDEAAAASAAGGGLGAASSAAGGSAEPPSDAYSLEAIVGASGKLALLHRLLLRLHAGGHRAVLFSQFTSMLDLLQSYCAAAGWRVARLDGSTNRVQRTVDINAFNAPGSKIFLFLMSTRAGGLGINCQTADTCILYDSDWNPQPDLQAMARVHRIGQTKKVHVYRLVTHGTVEARILQRAEKKLLLDRIVNQDATDEAGAAPPSAADEPSGSDLLAALKFGAQCCFSGGEGRAPTDEELAAITDRARTADASLGALRGGVQRAADSFDPAAVSTRIRELHGVEYGAGKAARQELDIGLEWAKQKAAKRQHVSTTTTTHVVGVGLVSVKKVNNYTMDEGMCLERAAGGRPKPPPGGARQVAGRDYDHESQCLACWDGGDLICCDFCPASFHLGCIGVRCATQLPFSWSCPHHACMQCNRKATSVGGLLFRCQVCPGAWCEDHLLEQALVVGANDRFEALGFRHPKEGCYVLCSHACKTWALEQGLLGAHGTDDFATAAAILGATGVDTTHAAAAARKSAAERNDWLRVDTRDSRARLDKPVRAALDETLKLRPLPLGAAIPLSTSGLEGLAAGERFVLYDAVQAAAALARNGALAAAGGEEEAPPDALGSAFYASNAARKAASDAALRALASWEGVPLEAAAVGGAAKAGSSAQKAAGSAAKAKKLKKALAEQQETLASFFIEISRLLEGERGETLARLSRALNLRVVTYGAGGAGGLVARPFGAGSGTGRKTLAQTIAFVLSRPAPAAFYLAAPTFEGVEGGGTTWLPLVTSRAFPWATHGVLDGQVRTRAAIAAASEPKVAATPTDGTPAVKRAASRSVDDESPTALPADDGAAGLAQPRAARALEAAAAAADAAAGSSLAGAPSAKRKRSGSRKAANFVVEAIVARRVEPAAASRKGAAGAESVSYLVKWEGFGSEANTWEPQQNILDEQLIRDFEQRQLGCASDPITLE